MRKPAYALAAAVCLAGTAAFAQATPDAARCQSLRNQYDRYAFAAKTEGGVAGHLEREIGVDFCRRGDYAAGIKELEKAIRLLGFRPD